MCHLPELLLQSIRIRLGCRAVLILAVQLSLDLYPSSALMFQRDLRLLARLSGCPLLLIGIIPPGTQRFHLFLPDRLCLQTAGSRVFQRATDRARFSFLQLCRQKPRLHRQKAAGRVLIQLI